MVIEQSGDLPSGRVSEEAYNSFENLSDGAEDTDSTNTIPHEHDEAG